MFVGIPQAIAALLYSFGEALPVDACAERVTVGALCSLLVSRGVARELTERASMAYHLQPSGAYFDAVDEPVATSMATARTPRNARYGSAVDSPGELHAFLRADDGGRTKPGPSDTTNANVLPAPFIEYARTAHASIDAWSPPAGIRSVAVTGWGMDTVSGIDFYGERDAYWVDLPTARAAYDRDFNHGTLLELDEVRVLVRDLVLRDDAPTPRFISRTEPDREPGGKVSGSSSTRRSRSSSTTNTAGASPGATAANPGARTASSAR